MKDLLNDLDKQIEEGQKAAENAKEGSEQAAEARLKKFVLAKHKVKQNRDAAFEIEKEGREILQKGESMEVVTMFRDNSGKKRSFKVSLSDRGQFDRLVAAFRNDISAEDQKLDDEYPAENVLMQQRKIPFTAEELLAAHEAEKS